MLYLHRLCHAALVLGVAAGTSVASAGGRPDSHAPIPVMGDHLHRPGSWMVSYRYMRMDMSGNRTSAHRVGRGRVLRDFPVAPTRMDMEMHMIGLMYGVTERVTLMGMLPILRLDMDHRTRMGTKFTTRSDGIGDVKIAGLIGLTKSEKQDVHASLGLSIPTGSITEKDDTPMGRVRLPYPMQLGSGTWDLLPGITWNRRFGDWSAGAQALGTVRIGRNRNDYRLGHRIAANLWGARVWTPWLSSSLRLGWEAWGDIEGEDDDLNPAVSPTADPDLRNGRRLDVGAGVNLLVRNGPLRGHRLALEFAYPLNEWLDGPQLETDWILTVGWQKAF